MNANLFHVFSNTRKLTRKARTQAECIELIAKNNWRNKYGSIRIVHATPTPSALEIVARRQAALAAKDEELASKLRTHEVYGKVAAAPAEHMANVLVAAKVIQSKAKGHRLPVFVWKALNAIDMSADEAACVAALYRVMVPAK